MIWQPKLRYLPNSITLLRMLLVMPIVLSIMQYRYDLALVLIAIAGLSDGLDGFLAKRYGWITRLGGILDPLADKLLMLAIILALSGQGALPVWLVALILLRDAVIVLGATVYYLWIEPFVAAPLAVSKLNTVVQLLLVTAVLYDVGIAALPVTVLKGLLWVTVLTTAASGLAYIGVWGMQAWRVRRRLDRNRFG